MINLLTTCQAGALLGLTNPTGNLHIVAKQIP